MNAPFSHSAVVAKPRRILLLAHEFVAQYRVLRAAAMTGAKVQVMGPEKARALALSRYCAGYHPCFLGHEAYRGIDAPVDPRAVAMDIDTLAREQGIDMVYPSDALTTRLLCAMRPFLETPTFPVPGVETFDALATKDAFMAFCNRRQLLHPRGEVFPNITELRAAMAAGRVRLPLMLKPVNRAGSIGVVKVEADNCDAMLARLDYSPILAQDYVDGEDRCITVAAIEGEVVKEVVYWHPDGLFRFGDEPALSAIVAAIVRELGLSGCYNFDARIGSDGRVWLIECNPRFFFNIDVVAVAGMNFAALDDAVPGTRVTLHHGDMRVPQASLRGILAGHLPTADDRKMLAHWLADPLVFGLVSAGFPRHWRAGWLESLAARLRRV